jgi:plastocyanin
VAIAGALVAVACGNDSDTGESSVPLVIEMTEWEFKGPFFVGQGTSPAETQMAGPDERNASTLGFLNIIGGATPDVELRNLGNSDHTFTGGDLGIDEALKPGETRIVEFDRSGDFDFYCRFHRDKGMRGSVSVTDTTD